MPIHAEVLFHDLFLQMVKPRVVSGGEGGAIVKGRRGRSAAGAGAVMVPHGDGGYYFPGSEKECSLEVFVRHARGGAGLGRVAPLPHSWDVAMQMKGVQGAARGKSALFMKCVRTALATHGSAALFARAVEAVAAATKAAGAGKQTSAASKMLQVFPQFWPRVSIYDSVVQRALGPSDIHLYAWEFDRQLRQPHVLMPGGRVLTLADFMALPDVARQLRQVLQRLDAYAGLSAADAGALDEFILRRSFDRLLWLMQAGKDLYGSRVFGLGVASMATHAVQQAGTGSARRATGA